MLGDPGGVAAVVADGLSGRVVGPAVVHVSSICPKALRSPVVIVNVYLSFMLTHLVA